MYIKLLVCLSALCICQSSFAGVLIGELPQGESADIRDLRWKIEGDEVTFVVVVAGSDGKANELLYGPFTKSMIRNALRYAADSRPLAVTVVNTSPLPDQKVLLHPALIDTPEGQHAIRLDLLVRRYAKSQWDKAAERAYRHHALYQLASTARLLAVLKIAKLDIALMTPQSEEQRASVVMREASVADLLKRATEDLNEQSTRKLAAAALAELPEATGERSLLRVKSEFYDQALVSIIANCSFQEGIDGLNARVASTYAPIEKEFQDCVGQNDLFKSKMEAFKIDDKHLEQSKTNLEEEIAAFQALPTEEGRRQLLAKQTKHNARVKEFLSQRAELLNAANDLDKRRNVLSEKLNRALKEALVPAPEITVPSGVRELRFGGALEDYSPKVATSLPFRFMVQVAFTTAPKFLKNGDPKDYSDSRPYEFTDFESSINTAVSEGIERDKDAGTTAREMAQFVLLQRIFRAAIAGKFGETFPTGRLAELGADVGQGSRPPITRTLRWSPNPLELETNSGSVVSRHLAAMKNEDSDDARATASVLTTCSSLIAERIKLRSEAEKSVKELGENEAKTAWDKYSTSLAEWMTKWEQAVGELRSSTNADSPVGKACAELAILTYRLQVRNKLQVVDDEWHVLREESGWHVR